MPTAAAVPTPSVTPALEQVVLDLPLKEYGSLQPINQDMEPPPPLIIEPEQPLQEGQQQAQQPVRRSTRIRRPPARHADYVPHSQIAFEAIVEPQPDIVDKQLSALIASTDPDVMYLWQAMKEPDWLQFKAAMQ
jgi:hypothetical protein